MSSDIVAYEDWKVKNLVKNRALAKSISDAACRSSLNTSKEGCLGELWLLCRLSIHLNTVLAAEPE